MGDEAETAKKEEIETVRGLFIEDIMRITANFEQNLEEEEIVAGLRILNRDLLEIAERAKDEAENIRKKQIDISLLRF